MRRSNASVALLPLAWLMISAPSAQDSSLTLLRRAASNYKAAETFWVEGDIKADARAGPRQQSTTATFKVAYGGDKRVHDELDHPQAGVVKVSDGKQTWVYVLASHEYAHQDQAEDVDLAHPRPGTGMLGVLSSALRGLAEDVDSIRTQPDETIPFGGADRRCAVIEVRYKPGGVAGVAPDAWRTYWVDRERELVLQHRTVSRVAGPNGESLEQNETFRYTRIALNQPIDPKLFTFTPPADARQVEQFGGRPVPEDLSGKVADDFTLLDLKGKKHSLKSLRGKVVMLDFWASWCGPCRRQMPMVDKLGRELKEKGLVVFAVNQGESSETARKYLEKNQYATTALLDQTSDVGRRYKVSGIPTLVIIDRQGKIAAHYVGLRTEDTLREGLKKAGL